MPVNRAANKVKSSDTQVVRAVTIVALSMAILIAVALPATYLWMSWEAQDHDADLSAQLHTAFVMQAIALSSDDWEKDVQGLLEVTLVDQPLPEFRRIINLDGEEVTANGYVGSPPYISAVRPLVTVNGPVGRLELQRSMLPIVRTAAIIALISTAFGAAIFLTLRVLPLRALYRALSALSEEQKRGQRQLENYVGVLFERAVDGIVVIEPDGTVRSCNPKAEEMLGIASYNMINEPVEKWIKPTMSSGLGFEVGQSETMAFRKVGTFMERFPCEISVNFLPATSDHHHRYVINLRDISERRQSEEKQLRLANYDSLTGLPNRAMFRESLEKAMGRSRRSGKMMALMFLDLDHFKKINDSLGHDAGDQLLQYVANTLTHCLRSGDTVMRRDENDADIESFIVSRLGGDEFTVIVEALETPEQARAIAARIRNAMHQPYFVDGEEIVITTSLCITLFPRDDVSLDELIKHADLAMYRAKELGRNAFQFYSDELSAEASLRLQLENRLRHALERNEFELHYQPKADLETGNITGVEALLRWRPNNGVIVPPDRFINLLEETGMILDVGEWVIRTAAAQTVAWNKAGLPPLHVAVNLSARQLHQEDLVDTVADILRETGLPASYLELELTESMLLEGDRHRETLRELSNLGISLAVDDFGTGYSSLSYLKRFFVNCLKIDRSFVRDAHHDPEDKAIATAIIALAKSLNLKVVAVGVENEEQLEFLTQQGCDEIQGFLLGRPMPASKFDAWIKGREALTHEHMTA